MKKITFLNLLIVIIYSSFSFGQYLDEGFEDSTSIPAEWTLTQTNANQTWVISTFGANTGSNLATVAYDLGTQNESLISPILDFSTATSPRLIFSWAMSYYWSVDPYDNYDFIVSIDDGTSVIELFSEDDAGVFNTSEFYTQTIDLSSYVGLSDVKIIFNYSGADGAFLNLDDILVEEAPSTPPGCASNFTDTADENCGNYDFSVSWDTVSDADGYLLTAGTTSGGNDLVDALDLGSSTTYNFSSVIIGQNYFYTVTPYNVNGNADGCEEQSVRTAQEGCYCASVPTSNDGTGISSVSLAGTDFTSGGDITYEDFT
ncbi:MAG: hypothetical protein CMC56_03595, partial [Flavobacteriaceae bacterium]|nr:hypothetical protein [Flavobacteriaceae bacterium]